MKLYAVMIGEATPEDFMQAYDRAVEREKHNAQIRLCHYEMRHLLDKLAVARREYKHLDDIAFWDPHLLTRVDKNRMKDLREYIAVLEARMDAVKSELKQLLN